MPTFSPRLFWLLPLCALALLLAWRPQAKAPASDYITASAKIRDLEQLIMADGTLKARKQVSVGAQVSGQIKKLHVTLGQEVKQGELLELTATEFNMLVLLVRAPEQVVTKDTLSLQGVGRPREAYDRSVDVHICNLRQKLQQKAGEAVTIETVRSIGYKIR